jgi:hypothetical protein
MHEPRFLKRRTFLCILFCLLFLAKPHSVRSQDTAGQNVDPQTSFGSKLPAASAPSMSEHWDLLSLKDNDLHAKQPIVGAKGTYPDFTRELLRVQWRSGDPIDLYVIRPTGVKNPPVILYLYGYPSETDRFLNDTFCRTVTKNGFAAVGFVSSLTGQRYHDRPMKEWFVSELQESIGGSVHDVQMILNYLSTRNDLDMDHVGMYGQGSGGTIAILAAAVEPRIKALDVMDPWGDWPTWLAKSPRVPEEERAAYLKPEFLAKVAPLDPVRWLPQLKARPFRLQENLFNPLTPEDARQRIDAALPVDAQLVQYHDPKEYAEKVSANGKMLDWLHAHLESPAPPLTATEFLNRAVTAEKRAKSQ